MPLVEDISILRIKSTDVTTSVEARNILTQIEKEFKNYPSGVGIAGIQIDHRKRVGLIIHKGERYELINPTLVDHEEEFIHHGEGCLSIPNTHLSIPRWEQMTITNMVLDDSEPDGWRKETHVHYVGDDKKDLTTIAIQHEMDHFDGVLITDKGVKTEPVRSGVKVGRNDPCPCGSGKKHKKCCLKKNKDVINERG